PARSRAAAAPPRRAGAPVDGLPRPARDPRPELPRLVERPVSDARREMLARIADALGPAAAVADPARAYRRAGTGAPPGDAQIVERFAERVDDYRARVHRVDRRELAALIVTLVPGSAAVAPAIGALVPAAWLGGDAGRVIDDGTL